MSCPYREVELLFVQILDWVIVTDAFLSVRLPTQRLSFDQRPFPRDVFPLPAQLEYVIERLNKGASLYGGIIQIFIRPSNLNFPTT